MRTGRGTRGTACRARPPGARGRWAAAVAALTAGLLLAGCGGHSERRPRAASDVTAVHTVDARAVPGLTAVTRNEQDDVRHLYAAYPKIPGADALTAELAKAVDDQIRPFVADTSDDESPPLPGGGAPELNVQWSLAAADGDVAGVRLVTWQFLGASGGETRRTLWYDGRARAARSSADLLNGAKGLAELAAQVRDRLGSQANPAQVTPDARTFSSLAFNERGDLVVEFGDYTVAPGSAGRVAVALDRSVYDPMLSEFGRRARDAALAPNPRLALGSPLSAPAAPGSSPAAPPPAPGARADCSRLKCVALTFDDGPGPYTRRLLGMLAERRARATFFVVGHNAEAHPDLIREEAAAGHEIGNHTQSHRDLSRLPTLQVNSDVQRTQDILRSALGRPPTLLRPPYGATNGTVANVAKSLGLRQIMWSVDTEDWRDRDARIVADRAVRHARPGAIILMHDIHGTTVDAVPRILERLAGKGYTFATVDDLLATHNVPPGGRYGGR